MSRLKLLAVIGLVLYALSRVQVHVPVAGPVPALVFAALAEAGFLAFVVAGIVRSLRASSRRVVAW